MIDRQKYEATLNALLDEPRYVDGYPILWPNGDTVTYSQKWHAATAGLAANGRFGWVMMTPDISMKPQPRLKRWLRWLHDDVLADLIVRLSAAVGKVERGHD